MSDAMSIIGTELAQYRAKVKRGSSLDLKEARAVQGYMQQLIQLSKEMREQMKTDLLEEMSTADLGKLLVSTLSEEQLAKLLKSED